MYYCVTYTSIQSKGNRVQIWIWSFPPAEKTLQEKKKGLTLKIECKSLERKWIERFQNEQGIYLK